MKLRKRQPRYKLPPHSQILSVVVEGNQRHNQMASYALPIVPLEEIGVDAGPGFPRRCAILRGIIEFAPPPDKPYTVRIEYTPPIMVY